MRWALLVLLIPGVDAATLHFHFGGPGAESVPMNLLPAQGTFVGEAGQVACTEITQVTQSVYGVAYAAPAVDGPEQVLRLEARGLGFSTNLTGAGALQWFVEAAAGANVVVEATLREGEDFSAGVDGYERGRLILQGASHPARLAGPLTEGATVHDFQGRTVYGITVPMQAVDPRVTPAGFNLRVDTKMEVPACTPTAPVRIHSSADLRPTLNITPVEALRVGTIEVNESSRGSVHLRAAVQSLWGPYAVLDAGLVVTGQANWASQVQSTTVAPQPDEASYRPEAPVHVLAIWQATKEAPAGSYEATFLVRGLDGESSASTTFTLEEGPLHPAAPALPPALALLACLLVAYRKRR